MIRINYIIGVVLCLIGLSLLHSCAGDCYQDVSGIIVDDKTKLPINSVFIQNIEKDSCYTYSDCFGFFELTCISGGISNCTTMSVIIHKTGYKSKSFKFELGYQDTIRLKRLNNFRPR
jgi:hypothetical protein